MKGRAATKRIARHQKGGNRVSHVAPCLYSPSFQACAGTFSKLGLNRFRKNRDEEQAIEFSYLDPQQETFVTNRHSCSWSQLDPEEQAYVRETCPAISSSRRPAIVQYDLHHPPLTLRTYLRTRTRATTPTWDALIDACIGLATAVKYAHDADMYLMNIEPANILVDQHPQLKLKLFDFSQSFNSYDMASGGYDDDHTRSLFLYPSGYWPPEAITLFVLSSSSSSLPTSSYLMLSELLPVWNAALSTPDGYLHHWRQETIGIDSLYSSAELLTIAQMCLEQDTLLLQDGQEEERIARIRKIARRVDVFSLGMTVLECVWHLAPRMRSLPTAVEDALMVLFTSCTEAGTRSSMARLIRALEGLKLPNLASAA